MLHLRLPMPTAYGDMAIELKSNGESTVRFVEGFAPPRVTGTFSGTITVAADGRDALDHNLVADVDTRTDPTLIASARALAVRVVATLNERAAMHTLIAEVQREVESWATTPVTVPPVAVAV